MIRKFNNNWGFDVYIDDKRFRKSNRNWTKAEAKLQEDLFIETYVNPKTIQFTYADVYQRFIDFKSAICKRTTIQKHDEIYRNHIAPTFADMPLKDIKTKDIRQWQHELLTKANYSNNMLSCIQTDLKSVLNWCVENEYLDVNPFNVRFVQRQQFKTELLVWDVPTFNQFISFCMYPYRQFFTFLFKTGLRKGEAVALLVSDYDGHGIKVNKTWDKTLGAPTPPKTNNSNRYVLLDDKTIDMINNMIACYDNPVYLFGGSKPLTFSGIERAKDSAIDKSGVPYLTIHGFRHSHITNLLASGVRTKDVAARCGDTEKMIIERYSHLFKDSQKGIVSLVNEW